MEPSSSHDIPSSPPSLPRNTSTSRPPIRGTKERRDPSVTPRKFRRFFTPRSAKGDPDRHALLELTGARVNISQSSPIRPFRHAGTLQENHPTIFTRDLKRRKRFHTPESSPEHTEDVKEYGHTGQDAYLTSDNIRSSPCERAAYLLSYIDEENDDEEYFRPSREPLQRIEPSYGRGVPGQLLNRSYNGMARAGYQRDIYTLPDWERITASFYSNPADLHITRNDDNSKNLPFCTIGCHTNSIVAVGEEEGVIRLLESSEDCEDGFGKTVLQWQPHNNAIIDMEFSKDDTLLATASGDQSARVVDMTTQATISILENHCATLKQVRFQPGANNNNVLATSSRDGSIQIWDLRCAGKPRRALFTHLDGGASSRTTTTQAEVKYARATNSIYDAHKSQTVSAITQLPEDAHPDRPSRAEAPARLGGVSVTAIQFMPEGLEHLLLSASEVDASIKLWDIRSLSTKSKPPAPLSTTRTPSSHGRFRHFGVSSLNLSTDGSRLYSLCRDSTIYAYSTAHLILGEAPELSLPTPKPTRQNVTKEGLGPLYGFRHPNLQVASFYVKSALRPAQNGKCEMLAAGSTDGSAVLFPTDERYFSKSAQPKQTEAGLPSSIFLSRPTLRRGGSSGRAVDDLLPVSTHGTALIRGHDREVGDVAWTSEGGLVTVGDDFVVRCWHEGDDARKLRTGGEGEGRRWGCGWADVGEEQDDDDEKWSARDPFVTPNRRR